MPKDSQIDKKHIRTQKSRGSATLANDALDGGTRNMKTQSGNRQKANDDKK